MAILAEYLAIQDPASRGVFTLSSKAAGQEKAVATASPSITPRLGEGIV